MGRVLDNIRREFKGTQPYFVNEYDEEVEPPAEYGQDAKRIVTDDTGARVQVVQPQVQVQPQEPANVATAGKANETVASRIPDADETLSPQAQNSEAQKYGMTQSQYDWMLNNGYSADVIEKAKSYNPATDGGFLANIFKQTHSSPSLNEEQLRRSRNIAGIGDAIGLLAQLYGANNNGLTAQRNASQTAQAEAQANEKYERTLYNQARQQYDNGLYQAKAADYSQGLSEREHARSTVIQALQAKRQDERQQQQLQELKEHREAQLKQRDQELAAKNYKQAAELELKASETAARIANISSQINDRKARTAIAAKSGNGGANGNGGAKSGNVKYDMSIKSKPDDKNANAKRNGKEMIDLELGKDIIQQVYVQALNDTEMIEKYKSYFDTDIITDITMLKKGVSENALVQKILQDIYDEHGYDGMMEYLYPQDYSKHIEEVI